MMAKIFRPMSVFVKGADGNWRELYDTSDAERYGELLPPILPLATKDVDERYIVNKLSEGLKDFTIDDYLLIMGDMETCGVAIGMILARQGSIKLLKWHKKSRTYKPREYGVELFEILINKGR